MRLRNKKTGETITLPQLGGIELWEDDRPEAYMIGSYTSLAELNNEWEDAPGEPEFFWYIDDFMIMCGTEGNSTDIEVASFTEIDIEKIKEVGNYFETKEEAELAVRKLKAWKRLKDGGFRFSGYSRYDWNGNESPAVAFEYSDFDKMFDDEQVVADLDICFGGEE